MLAPERLFIMDHQTAIATQAAERYVLNQLASDEHDQFEEHFFSCPECGEEVRWISIFTANARHVVEEQSRHSAAAFATVVRLDAAAATTASLAGDTRQVALVFAASPGAERANLVSGDAIRFSLLLPPSQRTHGHACVVLPAQELAPGDYKLILEDARGECARYLLRVRI